MDAQRDGLITTMAVLAVNKQRGIKSLLLLMLLLAGVLTGCRATSKFRTRTKSWTQARVEISISKR